MDGYTTADFDEAEMKCADEYDATMMSILIEHHGFMEYWDQIIFFILAAGLS